uniref:Uncharacterized protein n=1 Tax=Glossina brevipalpis TaxID=37001 RepID=A0A1A9W7B4_9MUSC
MSFSNPLQQPCQFSSKPGVTVLALVYHFATLGYLLKSKPATSKVLTLANRAISAKVKVSPAAYCWPSKKVFKNSNAVSIFLSISGSAGALVKICGYSKPKALAVIITARQGAEPGYEI